MINGIWVSIKIEIANVCVMPFGYGIGNYCMFILDVTLESLIGKTPTKIVQHALQRLNSKIPQCSEAYIEDPEENIIWHRLIEWLHEVHISNWTPKEKQRRVCMIDNKDKEYMKHAKKVCRKIESCWIPYSPEAALGLLADLKETCKVQCAC
jgi:hypothetical protein